MAIEHLAPHAGPEKIAEALVRDGCAIVDGVIGAAERARLERELAPWIAATPAGRDDFAGRRTRRTGGLIARSPASRELIAHPLILAAVDGSTMPATMICHYRVRSGQEQAFEALLERHWPALRRLGLATDEPSRVYRGADDEGRPLFWEIFSWTSDEAAGRVHTHPEVAAIWEPMDALCESREGQRNMEFPQVEPVRFSW